MHALPNASIFSSNLSPSLSLPSFLSHDIPSTKRSEESKTTLACYCPIWSVFEHNSVTAMENVYAFEGTTCFEGKRVVMSQIRTALVTQSDRVTEPISWSNGTLPPLITPLSVAFYRDNPLPWILMREKEREKRTRQKTGTCEMDFSIDSAIESEFFPPVSC